MLSRGIRPSARLARRVRVDKSLETLATVDFSSGTRKTRESSSSSSSSPTKTTWTTTSSAPNPEVVNGFDVHTSAGAKPEMKFITLKDVLRSTTSNSPWDSSNLLPAFIRNTVFGEKQSQSYKFLLSPSPSSSNAANANVQRDCDYQEMSDAFYTTMHNVLLRTSTQLFSSDIFARNGDSHYNYGNGHGNNSSFNNGMIQVRHFSSTGPSDNKDKTSAMAAATPTKNPTALVKKEKGMSEKAQAMLTSAIKSLASFLAKTPGVLWFYLTHPKEFKEKLLELKDMAKKEAHHYYMGSKLLMADLRTARSILGRTLQGTPLSRRERKQLIRTVTDVFRLVPMSIFVLIPFMEFALPFALKLFPNMLPSTFQDSLKAEEEMKRDLKSRLAMAEFFQE